VRRDFGILRKHCVERLMNEFLGGEGAVFGLLGSRLGVPAFNRVGLDNFHTVESKRK
jgi:hypothetical protein